MATLTTAIEVSLRSGQRGAMRSAGGDRWLVYWEEDGSYTLSHLPAQPAAYEMKSRHVMDQGELVDFARSQGWPIDYDNGWVPIE